MTVVIPSAKGDVPVHCAHTRLLPIADLKKRIRPDNPNEHSDEQVERLVLLFGYYGIRHPAILWRERGSLEAGHGRLMAAERMGMTHFPVDEQSFRDEDEAYGFMVADNAIQQQWAELNMAKINLAVPQLGPDFDIDVLGLKDFTIDVAEQDFPGLPVGERAPFQQMTFILHDEQASEVKRALDVAKEMGAFDGPNENSNGNALARICETFLTRQL